MGFPMNGGQGSGSPSGDPRQAMMGGLDKLGGLGGILDLFAKGMSDRFGGRAAAKGPMPDWWMDWYNSKGKFGGVPPMADGAPPMAGGAMPPQAAAPAMARRSGAGFQPMLQMLQGRRGGGGLLD
jgi:hypothetical protein